MIDVFIFGYKKNYSEIKRALISCFKDLKKNKIRFRLIIIFDGCKLKTDQINQNNIIKKIKKKFEKQNVEIIKISGNKGISYCRNEALKRLKSKFLFFLDGDDCIIKNKLSLSLKILKKNPSITGVYSNYYLNKKLIKNHYSKITNKEMYNYNSIPAPMSNLVYRASMIRKARFENEMNFLEDFDFLLNLRNPMFMLCPKALLKINHKKNYDRFNELVNRIRLIKKNRGQLDQIISIEHLLVVFLLIIYQCSIFQILKALYIIAIQTSILDKFIFFKKLIPVFLSRIYKKLQTND